MAYSDSTGTMTEASNAGAAAPASERLDFVNRANAGRSIPVKFSLGGDRGLNIFKPGYPKFVSEPCEAGDTQEDIEATATSQAGLSYDPVTRQYTYVWKTQKLWAGTCRQFVLTLADGTSHSALFDFRR